MDREKVISEFEDFVKSFSKRDDTYYKGLFVSVLALLKEKEAVHPQREHSGSGVTWWNVCGICKTAINQNDKYCHECGRAVKWE